MAFAIDVGGTRSARTSQGSDHTVDIPTWIRPGHLLVAYITIAPGSHTAYVDWAAFEAAGWTRRVTGALAGPTPQLRTAGLLSILSKVADGTEGSSIGFTTFRWSVGTGVGGIDEWLLNSVESTHFVRVYERHGVSTLGLEVATAGGSSATPDPPSLTPTWGAADTLWVATFGMNQNATVDSTPPTNYPIAKRAASSSDSGFSTIHYTCRQANTATENPGSFSGMSSNSWSAATLAIPPGLEGWGDPAEITTIEQSVRATTGTSHTVDLPATMVVGNLVFVAFTAFNNVTVTWPAGWTALVAGGVTNQTRTEVRYRTVDGTESSTISITTNLSVQSAHQSWQAEGHDPDDPPEATVTTGFSASPRPPNHTAATAKDYLVIVGVGASDDDDTAVYWSPRMTPIQQVESSASGSSCLSFAAWTTLRNQTAFALDLAIASGAQSPQQANAETMKMAAGENFVAYTIFIHPLSDGFQGAADFTEGTLIEVRPEVFREQVEFSTAVLRSYDGTEQRVSARAFPRHAYEAEYVLPTEAHARALHRTLLAGYQQLFNLPVWPSEIYISGALAAAATSIAADFTWSELVIGSGVLIISPDEATFEVGVVATRSDSAITLEEALTNSYPAGSTVVPLAPVYLDDDTALARFRGGIEHDDDGGALLQITTRGTLQPDLFEGTAEVTEFDGFTVLDRRHLSGDTLDQEFHGEPHVFDYGDAISQFSSWTADLAIITEVRRFLVETLEERAFWNAFLVTVGGARETFLAPTWRHDLVLSTQPTQGATTILVTDEPNANGPPYESSAAHDYIQLETVAGYSYHEVTNAADNGNGTVTLTITPALTDTADGSTIERISFLERVRLASDVATFDHRLGGPTVLSIATVTVQE